MIENPGCRRQCKKKRQKTITGLLGVIVRLLMMVAVISACAKRGFPGGGPEDKTPPFVATWFPASGSAGVESGHWIEIQWNEPVNKGTLEDNLIVSPDTSALVRKWNGTTLKLRPRDGWMRNQTHWVWIRRGVIDRHGLASEEPFGMWFSTRNDSLPPAVVEGSAKLSPNEPAAGALVVAAQRDSGLVWTLPAMEDGMFRLSGLEPGIFDIEVFIDFDHDGKYKLGAEPWAKNEIAVLQDSTVVLELTLAVEDTTHPFVLETRAIHASFLHLAFSEPVLGVSDSSFSLSDTTGQSYAIAQCYRSTISPAEVSICLTTPMRDELMELLFNGVTDSVGLSLTDTSSVFLGTSLPDTINPFVDKLIYSDESPPTIWIAFNEPVRQKSAEVGISVLTLPGGRKLPIGIEPIDPSLIECVLLDSLFSGERLLLSIGTEVEDLSASHLESPVITMIPDSSDYMVPAWELRPHPSVIPVFSDPADDSL